MCMSIILKLLYFCGEINRAIVYIINRAIHRYFMLGNMKFISCVNPQNKFHVSKHPWPCIIYLRDQYRKVVWENVVIIH